MASHVRTVGTALLLSALLVVAGVVCFRCGHVGARPQDAEPDAIGGASERAAASSGETTSSSSKTAASPGGSGSRGVARAKFEDTIVATSPEHIERPALPAHLRRIVVRLVFDDGYPLADMSVSAYPAPLDGKDGAPDGASAEANAASTWSIGSGTVLHTKTDADGRATFCVSDGARFMLSGEGGPGRPPLASGVIRADADEVVATVAARPVRLMVVDESGAPFPNLLIEAGGTAPTQPERAWCVTDADGRAVFRGFAGRVGLSLNVDDGEGFVEAYFVRRSGAVEDDGDSIFVATDSESRLVARRLTAASGRIVDGSGVPVANADVVLTAVYAGGFHLSIADVESKADGRWRCVLMTDGRWISDASPPATLRLEVRSPGVSTPTVVERPFARFGADCSFGDVAVPTAPRVKFRVVNAAGAPVARVIVNAEFKLPPDAPQWTLAEHTNSNGVVVVIEPASDVRFSFQGNGAACVVSANDEARRLDGPGQKVVMPEPSGLMLVVPPGEPRADDWLSYEARWNNASSGEERVNRGRFLPDGRERLPAVAEGTKFSIVLYACGGRYAEIVCIAPPTGEVREVPLPLPPKNVLNVRVVDEAGSPVTGFGVSVHAVGGEDGEPLIEESPQESRSAWSTPCIGDRSGEMLLRIDVRGAVTEQRVMLTPPFTDVVVRVEPPRTVRLVLRDPSSASLELNSVSVHVVSGPTRLKVPGEHDGRTAVFTMQAPRSEVVRFRVDYAGEVFAVDAAPHAAEVELALPAVGTIVAVVAPRPARALMTVDVVPLAAGSVVVQTTKDRGPSEPVWRSAPIRVRPGRCSVTARLCCFGYSPRHDGVELGVREVVVVAGRETVLEF